MTRRIRLALLSFAVGSAATAAPEERFNVRQIEVQGNTLLSDRQLADLMGPLIGKGRALGDLIRTRRALESAYRAAGHAAVRVSIPEQVLAAGVVTLRVAEQITDVERLPRSDPIPDTDAAAAPAMRSDSTPAPIASTEAAPEPVNPSEMPQQPIVAEPAPQAPFAAGSPATEPVAEAPVEDERFDVKRFHVEGNTLLAATQLDTLLTPLAGEKRVYGDIQKALEAVEGAYRAAGYNTVQVFVPEQELSQGIVTLQVTEGVIDKVSVTGNKHFSTANVRAALPALKEGVAPNARQLSKNIQLSNDNPAKQVEVTLGVSEEEGKIDAKIAVTEEDPLKYSITFDNTGSSATGKHRSGFAAQYANLFDSDQMLTLAYTTSPDAPKGVKVDILSVAYRWPLYGLGDSIDVVYGKSSVNTPTVQATGFGLTGKGDVLALRYNRYLPRKGEYSGKVSLGFDYKYFNTRCSINGIPQSFEPPVPAIASCTPHTSRPISIAYSGQRQGADSMYDYNLSLAYNLPIGNKYQFNTGMDYYSLIANRPVKDRFSILRYGGSYLTVIFTDWQLKASLSGQYTRTGLIGGEQFGLAGGNVVRGFTERAIAGDTGQMVNIEAYSPELAKDLGAPGSLRGVLFFDISHGRNIGVVIPSPATAESVGVASAGLGLRYNAGKDVNLRADVGRVTKAGPPGTEALGDWRGHFNMLFSF